MSLLELVALGAPARCAGCKRPGAAFCRACSESLGSAPVPVVPGVDQLVVGFPYEAGARSLVLGLKLKGNRGAAAPLAAAMVREVAGCGLTAEAVTWVPGRPDENRRRGLDHAGVLAAEVGRRLGLPVHPLLSRTGERPDQASLGAAERWANLQGAFVATDCPERVALVDDLVTTGATASACAGALRAAGAVRVEVLAACSA
ncbi:phosphoribosyltransferase family protein [soil metagenome]